MTTDAPFPPATITVAVGHTRLFDYGTVVGHFTHRECGRTQDAQARRLELRDCHVDDESWVEQVRDQIGDADFDEFAVRDVPGPKAACFLIEMAEAGHAVVCSLNVADLAAAREFFAEALGGRALPVPVAPL